MILRANPAETEPPTGNMRAEDTMASEKKAFVRYKLIIGDRLRARYSRAQEAEAPIACTILSWMIELGRPASCAIGA